MDGSLYYVNRIFMLKTANFFLIILLKMLSYSMLYENRFFEQIKKVKKAMIRNLWQR